VYWYHKEVPRFFFEFCCGITEKIDVDDWTKRNNSQSKLNKIIVQFYNPFFDLLALDFTKMKTECEFRLRALSYV
jgi:hypothetical protein